MNALLPILLVVALVSAYQWGGTFDRLTGSDKARKAIDAGTLPHLLDEWDREAAQFKRDREAYLLYR